MKITDEDVIEYLSLFTSIPSFLLGRWARSGTNLASRFCSRIVSEYGKLSDHDRRRVRAVLEMDVDEIQEVLRRAHERTGKKQLMILSDPSSREFIERNLAEIRSLIGDRTSSHST